MSEAVKIGKNANRVCDFCGQKAYYDGRTKAGPWAFMCESDFKKHGVGLGTGHGQKLIYED